MLASSTTTAAALTVRLDPELVAPSLQPSKPCLSCCCTLDRPEKRPGATLFAGNCTQQRSLRLAAHFQDWLVLGAPGGWCCAGAGTKCKGLWLEGNQEAGSSWRCRGLHAPQLQTNPATAGWSSIKAAFTVCSLLFPTFFSTQY